MCVSNYNLEFIFEPVSSCQQTLPFYQFSLPEQRAIDDEIRSFLSKHIIDSHFEPGHIISPIFIRPKKESGKFRVIFNLQALNEYVAYHKFKMDTLQSAINLMKPGCFMMSIDLRDAYYSVPVSPTYRKYLKFIWRDQLYQFTCLPMGLSSSPRIFTKIMKPVFAHLRSEWGHCCFGYIDDSIYLEDTQQLAETSTLHATQLLTRLGFVPHPTKSVFEPTQNLEFLGFQLNSVTMQVKLTPKKIERLINACQRALAPQTLSIRDLASLIGSLVATFPGVQFGPLHYRTLEHDKNLALQQSNYHFDAKVVLSPGSRLDLNWWVRSLPTSFKTIDHGKPQVFIHTDTSQVGWGATLSTAKTQGLWTSHEAQSHINTLELLAIKFGLQSLLNDSRNTHIRIQSDNTTAIAYITEMGECHSAACNSVAQDIWDWAILRHNWLSASFIPGKQNVPADRLSRACNAGTEWQLSPSIFMQISSIFGRPSLDLFASRVNHQLRTYISWHPDPGATYVDAFTVD